MAVVLALPKLFDAVVARFAAESTAVANLFGWRTPAQRLVLGNRICWVPGDEDGGVGTLGPARHPGQNPRSIATLPELFYVDIIASDTNRENERAQYQVTRELFDAWWRAVYLAAHGTVAIVSADWITDKKERRYGAGLRVVCTVEAMIPDAPYTDATIGVDPLAAVIVTTMLDVVETDTIEGA